MTDDKITLDKDVFKTLASETRVGILKSLDHRRKTLSELSKQLGMSVSTVKEHLDNLVGVDLIVQMDDGHKWKYYELTSKGKAILHPEDRKVWILLGISVLSMIVLGFDYLRNSLFSEAYSARLMMAEKSFESAPMLSDAAPAGAQAADLAAGLPLFHIAGLVIFGLIMAASALYIRKSRKNVGEMFKNY